MGTGRYFLHPCTSFTIRPASAEHKQAGWLKTQQHQTVNRGDRSAENSVSVGVLGAQVQIKMTGRWHNMGVSHTAQQVAFKIHLIIRPLRHNFSDYCQGWHPRGWWWSWEVRDTYTLCWKFDMFFFLLEMMTVIHAIACTTNSLSLSKGLKKSSCCVPKLKRYISFQINLYKQFQSL